MARKDSKGKKLRDGEQQRADGRYMYRWTGKDNVRHTIYAKDLNELRQKEKKIIIDEEIAKTLRTTDATINDRFERLIERKPELEDSTVSNYIYLYNSRVKPSFGKNKIGEVRKSDVKDFYIKLRNEDELALTTIGNINNLLYQVFDEAIDDRIIDYNPCSRVIKNLGYSLKKDEDGNEVGVLDRKDEEALFSFLENSSTYKHWAPFLFIMANTGMRVGETMGLCWEYVDFENNYIHVKHSISYRKRKDSGKCEHRLGKPKTKAGTRKIPMMESVKNVLKELKAVKDEFNLESTLEVSGRRDFVFLNKYSRPFEQSAINDAIDRILNAYEIEEIAEAEKEGREPYLLPDFTSHWLRHTFATNYYKTTKDVKSLQVILGHSDIQTTLNIYVKASDEDIVHNIGALEKTKKTSYNFM